jgi:hypothetical protein
VKHLGVAFLFFGCSPTAANVPTPPDAAVPLSTPATPSCVSVKPDAFVLPLEAPEQITLPEAPALDDPQATLAPFYTQTLALLRGERKDAVRIAMVGDSNLTMDTVTSGLRRQLQGKFGDAGHGFIASARPWAWYHHQDIRQDISMSLWTHFTTSTKPTHDHHYGISHIAGESLSPGAKVTIETAKDDAPIGTHASKLGAYYMQRPEGGEFVLSVDGTEVQTVDTRGDETVAKSVQLEVADQPHKLILTVKKGHVRTLGFTFERNAASFVVDSFGIGSMNYEQFGRVSAASRDPMLKERNYALILFMIGTNVWATESELKTQLTNVISWYRAALPGVPLVFLSPPDAAAPPAPTHSDTRLPKLGILIHKIATENGAAFWDFRAAMGGEMSMVRFVRAGLAEYDFVHMKESGGAVMGAQLGRALFAGARAHLATQPTAGCTQ